MIGSERVRPSRLSAIAVLLYAAFLVIAPFEHHDLACHVKTPFHCLSCSSSVVSADPQIPAAPGTFQLPDVGSAVVLPPTLVVVLLSAASAGRSPPSA